MDVWLHIRSSVTAKKTSRRRTPISTVQSKSLKQALAQAATELNGDIQVARNVQGCSRRSCTHNLRRRFASVEVGKGCDKVAMRDARVGVRCATKKYVTTTLPDTSEGNFVFRAPVRSFPYGVYTKVVANFQILRGA